MFRVGLTGGIGSGKSSLATEFKKLGVPVIDLDQVSREVVKPGGPALNQIVEHFGSSILTTEKTLDRDALRQRVFQNTDERIWLETTLHPLIRLRCSELEDKLNTPYLILEIPLLTENRDAHKLDRVLVVDLPESIQIKRTMQRSGLSETEVRNIIVSQASREVRLSIADDIVENRGSPQELKQRAAELHEKYLSLAVSAGH
jgi:dephospho-CoA kinase